MVEPLLAGTDPALARACDERGAGGRHVDGQGSITLVRHAEPAMSRRIRVSAAGYRRWWAMYEAGGIVAGQTPPASLIETAAAADVVVVSSRRRALETAGAVAPGRPVEGDPMFVEAPLPPPPLPDYIKLSPMLWGVLARTAWWFFGHHEGGEKRTEAEVRARAAADKLIGEAKRGRNVLLLAHGFFNLMVGRELKRRGWRRAGGRGYKYWATRRYVAP